MQTLPGRPSSQQRAPMGEERREEAKATIPGPGVARAPCQVCLHDVCPQRPSFTFRSTFHASNTASAVAGASSQTSPADSHVNRVLLGLLAYVSPERPCAQQTGRPVWLQAHGSPGKAGRSEDQLIMKTDANPERPCCTGLGPWATGSARTAAGSRSLDGGASMKLGLPGGFADPQSKAAGFTCPRHG